ncbi:histidine phosphatase family protein [Mycobacterium sp. MS1601]|uniref:histidine phosphatase family protein n=1 Tax=Mycobacterium sp. MS1601 TaxID=1936029 RepID=UPI0009797A0C|nr:histidine phosphatase family protein [Mycobacterium sp. MS1601]AQA02832.1 histidine phosphatase family protein [Mycobacterium sp. MS1601]
MQLLLIRHALPQRTEHGQGSDPDLAAEGIEQAKRLPEALQRFPLARLVSSPQRRAVQTAGPLAAALDMTVEVDDRLAEYDRDMAAYIPVELLRSERPEDWARMADGHLPGGVDEGAFRARIGAAVADIVAVANHEDTVAVFSHGGVINVLLHEILGTTRLLSFPVDYVSVTRLLYSRAGQATVVAVNGTEHVWDLLPRNRRWA